MDPAVSRYLSELGRKGGRARLRTMTPEERRRVATKASKAAAIARRKKAKQKRKKTAWSYNFSRVGKQLLADLVLLVVPLDASGAPFLAAWQFLESLCRRPLMN